MYETNRPSTLINDTRWLLHFWKLRSCNIGMAMPNKSKNTFILIRNTSENEGNDIAWRMLCYLLANLVPRDVRVCFLLLSGPPPRVHTNKMFRKAIRAVCHSYSPTTFLVGGTVRLQNRQLNIHEYQVSLQLSVYSTSCGQLERLSTSDRAPNF